MKCPDIKIIELILEHNQRSDYQAVTCLRQCKVQAVSVLLKMNAKEEDDRDSIINHAMVEFIMQVRKGKFRLTGAAAICTYLTEIARRLWLDFSRKNKKPELAIAEEETNPNEEANEKVQVALQQLTYTDRDILVAFYFYDMPLEEYAEKKRISHDAAKQRISRARGRLKEILKQT